MHKNKISGLVNYMCYNEKKPRFRSFYESIDSKKSLAYKH